MKEQIIELIKKLTEEKKTISMMESCTGGGLCNAFTNIKGASDVLKFGAVTYSNEFKIKMGVDPEIIDKYTVYSMETADEMSYNIALFTSSNYGIGVTGKLNQIINDKVDSKVYISIYDQDKNIFFHREIVVNETTRPLNKAKVIETVIADLTKISE